MQPSMLRALFGCLLIWLAGCQQTTLTLQTRVPEVRSIESLPLSVALVYDESIKNYTHEESFPEGRNWLIRVGNNQERLMTETFTALFDRLLILDNAESADGIDLTIIPKLKDFQFATPLQTGRDQFETWLQYSIELLDAEGSLLNEWPLSAYGSVTTTDTGRADRFLGLAINRALRDAMAQLLVDLPNQPEIKKSLIR